MSTQFSSIRPINRILPSATTLGQSRSGSRGIKKVVYIPQGIGGVHVVECLKRWTAES